MGTISKPPPSPRPDNTDSGFSSYEWQRWFSSLPSAIQAYAGQVGPGLILNQAITGFKYSQDGASINRLNDRVFVSGATINDGASPNITKDWLTNFQQAAGLTNGSILSAQMAVLSGQVNSLNTALVVGSESVGSLSSASAATAIQAYAVNNNTTLATKAWALYCEAHRTTAAVGGIVGAEIETRSLFASVTPTPYTVGDNIGLQLGSGCGLAAAGQFNASAAIQIIANPMRYATGIMFGATSLTGTDGTGTGSGIAVGMAQGHKLQWYNSGGATTSSVLGNGSIAAQATKLIFDDTGANITDSNNSVMAQFPYIASPVNYLALSSGAAGTGVRVTALGTDTDINLTINPKGAGRVILGGATSTVRFGVYAAGVTAQNGYILMEDSSGTVRKVLVG